MQMNLLFSVRTCFLAAFPDSDFKHFLLNKTSYLNGEKNVKAELSISSWLSLETEDWELLSQKTELPLSEAVC